MAPVPDFIRVALQMTKLVGHILKKRLLRFGVRQDELLAQLDYRFPTVWIHIGLRPVAIEVCHDLECYVVVSQLREDPLDDGLGKLLRDSDSFCVVVGRQS